MIKLTVCLECAVCLRAMSAKPGRNAVLAAFVGAAPDAIAHVCPGCLEDVCEADMDTGYRHRALAWLRRAGVRVPTRQAGAVETVAEFVARGGRVRRYSVGGQEVQ